MRIPVWLRTSTTVLLLSTAGHALAQTPPDLCRPPEPEVVSAPTVTVVMNGIPYALPAATSPATKVMPFVTFVDLRKTCLDNVARDECVRIPTGIELRLRLQSGINPHLPGKQSARSNIESQFAESRRLSKPFNASSLGLGDVEAYYTGPGETHLVETMVSKSHSFWYLCYGALSSESPVCEFAFSLLDDLNEVQVGLYKDQIAYVPEIQDAVRCFLKNKMKNDRG